MNYKRNERSVLTVSTLIEGEYGLDDACLSAPCIISEKGVENIIEANLEEDELKGLKNSASVIKKELDKI